MDPISFWLMKQPSTGPVLNVTYFYQGSVLGNSAAGESSIIRGFTQYQDMVTFAFGRSDHLIVNDNWTTFTEVNKTATTLGIGTTNVEVVNGYVYQSNYSNEFFYSGLSSYIPDDFEAYDISTGTAAIVPKLKGLQSEKTYVGTDYTTQTFSVTKAAETAGISNVSAIGSTVYLIPSFRATKNRLVSSITSPKTQATITNAVDDVITTTDIFKADTNVDPSAFTYMFSKGLSLMVRTDSFNSYPVPSDAVVNPTAPTVTMTNIEGTTFPNRPAKFENELLSPTGVITNITIDSPGSISLSTGTQFYTWLEPPTNGGRAAFVLVTISAGGLWAIEIKYNGFGYTAGETPQLILDSDTVIAGSKYGKINTAPTITVTTPPAITATIDTTKCLFIDFGITDGGVGYYISQTFFNNVVNTASYFNTSTFSNLSYTSTSGGAGNIPSVVTYGGSQARAPGIQLFSGDNLPIRSKNDGDAYIPFTYGFYNQRQQNFNLGYSYRFAPNRYFALVPYSIDGGISFSGTLLPEMLSNNPYNEGLAYEFYQNTDQFPVPTYPGIANLVATESEAAYRIINTQSSGIKGLWYISVLKMWGDISVGNKYKLQVWTLNFGANADQVPTWNKIYEDATATDVPIDFCFGAINVSASLTVNYSETQNVGGTEGYLYVRMTINGSNVFDWQGSTTLETSRRFDINPATGNITGSTPNINAIECFEPSTSLTYSNASNLLQWDMNNERYYMFIDDRNGVLLTSGYDSGLSYLVMGAGEKIGDATHTWTQFTETDLGFTDHWIGE